MTSIPRIGIMQGRLSPQVRNTIQSFPQFTWQDEFPLARKAGLCCIEWIYEAGTDAANPLRTKAGIRSIKRSEKEWSVDVRSICADYYMQTHIINPSGAVVFSVLSHLEWLVGQASSLECEYIIIPFVDSSSIKTAEQIQGLKTLLHLIIPTLEEHGVEIHLETDLRPALIYDILTSLNHKLIRSNYDIGNSASLGHDPREELPVLKDWIGSIHIKDRILGGGTVPLGSGAADFSYCFKIFREQKFQRPFILQAARSKDLSELDLAIYNRTFIESFY